MCAAVLITQCLQRDFVGPVGAHEPLPNRLHVGRREALRLLGEDPQRGALSQLMGWARASGVVEVVHLLDWHDAADPLQAEHLATFGPHCLAGTPGAELVFGLGPGEHVIRSRGLNDFEGTPLARLLEQLRKRHGGGPLRVGVVGVWTEAKVTFLLYDLRTRAGLEHLATCSALTASDKRSQHLNALEQLRRVLGVNVLDSVGEFAEWLAGSRAVFRPPTLATTRPRMRLAGDAETLSEQESELLAYLYRDSASLELQPLSGGFSGARVFRVASTDALGHEQAPTVAKIGERHLVGKERAAFERVEEILGNVAPAIRGFADFPEVAGIKYAFATMRPGPVRPFKKLYEGGAPQPQIDEVLRRVFEEILGRFSAAAQYEKLDLLDYYRFAPRLEGRVRERVAALAGCSADAAEIEFPGGARLPNPADLYRELADLPRPPGESHYVSFVHGDLNGANILIDSGDNVWLIDFAHAARGHVLQDLAKLENDLLYIFTPLETEEDLAAAIRLSAALDAVSDLGAPLPPQPGGTGFPQLTRAWETLRTLRRFVARACREDRDPSQMSVALLRYSAHTLFFDESSPLQKRWALAACCLHAKRIRETLGARVLLAHRQAGN
ncbi:MAG: isochorismatase family protein [Myxococcales bacterium]|jgi:nicotinamidase-related amidase